MRVQQIGISATRYWSETQWVSTSTFVDATLNSDGTEWTLPEVNLDAAGNYRVRVIAYDNAGNVSQASQNPGTDFSVK